MKNSKQFNNSATGGMNWIQSTIAGLIGLAFMLTVGNNALAQQDRGRRRTGCRRRRESALLQEPAAVAWLNPTNSAHRWWKPARDFSRTEQTVSGVAESRN